MKKAYAIVFLLIATLAFGQGIGGMLGFNQTWTGNNTFTGATVLNTLTFSGAVAGPGGFSIDTSGNLTAKSIVTNGAGPGVVKLLVGTFSAVTATTPCNGTNEGYRAGFTDSTTTSYGATIAGGSGGHVNGYCNGTNWVVD